MDFSRISTTAHLNVKIGLQFLSNILDVLLICIVFDKK